MNTEHKYSLYKIDNENSIPFSLEDYSCFKYGDGNITNIYAEELSLLISELINEVSIEDEIIVYPSPFSFLPTASCHMTFKIFEILKAQHPKQTIKLSKVERKNTYPQDYGEMNKEDRYNLIKNDSYDFQDVPDKTSKLIFIDDISVTGTHQRIIQEILSNKQINNNCYFVYYAAVVNNEIDPRIENKLNYHYVNNVAKLSSIFLQESFLLNTRYVKKILSLEKTELIEFIDSISSDLGRERLKLLLDGAVKNNYGKIPEFVPNLNFLHEHLLY